MQKSINISVAVENINEATLERLESLNVGLELSYFSLPWNLKPKNLKQDIQRHRQLLKDFPLQKSLHGAFYGLNPTARDEMLLDVCRFRINQSIDIATELEMNKIVLHANYFHSNKKGYKEYWTEKQVAFWSTFIPTLEQRGITIFIENTREENPSFISEILTQLNHPNFKTCYDTGHSNCFTNTKLHVTKWVKAYGQQLGYIHLHSNDAMNDLHIAFHKGQQNFDGFFEAVLDLNPLPELIIEVKSREDFMESLVELRKIIAPANFAD